MLGDSTRVEAGSVGPEPLVVDHLRVDEMLDAGSAERDPLNGVRQLREPVRPTDPHEDLRLREWDDRSAGGLHGVGQVPILVRPDRYPYSPRVS